MVKKLTQWFMTLMVMSSLFLSSCVPISRSQTEDGAATSVSKEAGRANDTDGTWVPEEIIVLGTPKGIQQAIESLNLREIEGTPTIDVSGIIIREYLERKEQAEVEEDLPELFRRTLGISAKAEQLKSLVSEGLISKLFRLPAKEISVTDAIAKVDGIRGDSKEIQPESFVFAQPNYWLAPSAAPHGTDCKGVGAAPYPSHIGTGSYGEPILGPNQSDFLLQSAFFQIAQADASAFEENAAGDTVRIVIFDTSPVEKSDDIPPSVNTNVAAVINFVSDIPSGPSSLNQHGLFVASLANSVAPKSTIELRRVLGDDTCGIAFELDVALFDLWATSDPAEKMVLNLSLVYDRNNGAGGLAPDFLNLLLLLIFGDRDNTVIVAAVGNEGKPGNPHPAPLFPAAYHGLTHLLAVSSLNQNDGPSCFSNNGGVSAPGGEGKFPGCLPWEASDINSNKIGQNLIGETTDGYAYWSGTSFASPIVSGLAARCLSNNDSGAATYDNLDQPTLGASNNPVSLTMCP